MNLAEAFELRKRMAERKPNFTYGVFRSGKRTLGVTPYYVKITSRRISNGNRKQDH
jgi:hypothetical protein